MKVFITGVAGFMGSHFQISGISIPVAVLIWVMIYPMMMKVDFQSVKQIGENDPENSALDSFSLELFEDISYIMAKHADPQGVPDTPDEWLDQFGTFSIYQVLPEIIELWGLNVQTQVESKKNFERLTGK